MLSYILAVIVGILTVIADQYTKVFVANNFVMGRSYDFIPGLLDITYIHNDGAAWGMLSNNTWMLISITIVVMLVCIALLLKNGVKNKVMFWAIILVLAGGVGNMIDRIFRDGNVIDFLHFEFWKSFPVFNVADCAVVVGAGLLILYFVMDIIDDNKKKKAALTVSSAQKGSTEDENN